MATFDHGTHFRPPFRWNPIYILVKKTWVMKGWLQSSYTRFHLFNKKVKESIYSQLLMISIGKSPRTSVDSPAFRKKNISANMFRGDLQIFRWCLSPENERMSPENQWLVQMYFLLKVRPFSGSAFVSRSWCLMQWRCENTAPPKARICQTVEIFGGVVLWVCLKRNEGTRNYI